MANGMERFRKSPGAQVAALIAALTVVKAAAAAQIALTGYEATYWYYAQHPALGYFDHPAMIMWMVGASTAIFGDSYLGMRALTILAGGLTLWLTFLAGRRLYGPEAGRLAAFILGMVPMIFSIGSRVDPDCPLFLFWMAALWALAHAFSGGRPSWWYAAGAFLGLAMESKYPAIFFPIGILIFLALSPDHRHWLKRPQPYLACLIALVVFSPTVIWNARHDWESFLFQATGRIPGIEGPRLNRLHGYPVSHLLLFTPFICLWAWAAGARAAWRWRSAPWQDRLMAAVGLPTLLFFLAVLVARPVKHHWPTPGYLSLFLLSSAAVIRGGPWGRRLHRATLGVLGVGYLALPFVLTQLSPDYTDCWERLAAEVRRRSPDFVIARETWTATRLGYELRPLPACDFSAVGEEGRRLARWWRPESLAGKDAVIVYESNHYPDGLDLARKAFERVDDPVELFIPRDGNRKTSWMVLRAHGYRPGASVLKFLDALR